MPDGTVMPGKTHKEEVEVVDEGLTGARAMRARQMQDSDTKRYGGKRTDADRDTAFRLGTGTGPGRVSDRPVKSQSAQGMGNAAKRRMGEEVEIEEGLVSGIETSRQIRKDFRDKKAAKEQSKVEESCGSTHSDDKQEKTKEKIKARSGPPGYKDTSRTKPMGEAYLDMYERLNPFQVTFDKDGKEEDRKKRDSTPEAKAADEKRAKNRADNMKKGPMAYKPYGNNE